MGIAFSFLPFLDACFEQGALQSPVLALGSLSIHESPESIAVLAARHSYSTLACDHSVRALMRDRYGVTAYHDCDVNGLAELNLDIGKPLESSRWKGQFGTVLNGGTIEHVFDVRQAMINVHELTRTGGSIIHLAPVTWINHAFVNFNPKIFRSIAEVNCYEILVENLQVPSAANSEEDCHRYLATKRNTDDTMRDRVSAVLNASSLPSNILYMIAMRKISQDDFNIPYDVAT